MNLRSKQINKNQESLILTKPRNKIKADQICGIPVTHIKLPRFKSVIFIADQNMIMATNIFEDKFVAKVINNKIKFCYGANKVLSEYKYAIVDFKKQQLIAFQGGKIIKLQLFNFVIVEEGYLRGFYMNNFQFRVIQDESNQNYFIIFVAYIKMELRKIANSKVQFQLIQKHTPSNFQINKYCLAYEERAHFYIRYNSNGKLIRKLFCPYRGYKYLDSILVIPHRYINQEYCTEIVNSNSMKLITQLNAKSEQYVDSILVKGANKLIILNKINIMAYDARNYQLIDEIKIPNYGIPRQINYNIKTGIQIYYENYNIEYPKQQN